MPLWVPLWIAAIIAGLFAGYLTSATPVALGLLAMLAWLAQRAQTGPLQRGIYCWAAALLALALAMHRVPGFRNPIVIDHLRLSADAAPFTLYANFDKASAGLILVVFLCNRAKTSAEWKSAMRKAMSIAIATTAGVLATALAYAYYRTRRIEAAILTHFMVNAVHFVGFTYPNVQ